MVYTENLEGKLTDEQLYEVVRETLIDFGRVKKVLLLHPDYTRGDFSDRLVPLLYRELKSKGMTEIHSLNAGGTHRRMSEDELQTKLGISPKTPFAHCYNHEYNDPEQLVRVGKIPASFVAKKTGGHLTTSISVTVNKLILQDYDVIIALTGTAPHEAAGYAGGLKVFFPGVSGPELIDIFHWAAVLIGVPDIIGSVDNPARDIINEGSRCVFQHVKAPAISFNMVSEEKEKGVIAKGLYTGAGREGFSAAYEQAAKASSKLHIVYIDEPVKVALQRIGESYDEIWTAGKGSYKLQRPGVMAADGEIIIYAPHIGCFHSKSEMDAAMRQIGYHSKGYVEEYLRLNSKFNRNVAAHVINVRGPGRYDVATGTEKFAFKVTLATGISKEVCQAVGLGYRDPRSIHKQDFTGPGKLWIYEGGKYLYDITA